jgi:ribosomal protein L29
MLRRFTKLIRLPQLRLFSSTPQSDKFQKSLSEFTSNHLYREVTTKDDQGMESNSMAFDYGRAWLIHELRLKSSEDLHKLWHVLVIEKNRIFSDGLYNSKTMDKIFVDRLRKVKLSMTRIRTVLRERKKVQEEFRRSLEEAYYKQKEPELEEEFESKYGIG